MEKLFAEQARRLQLEKLVIGISEPILIKGVGEFLAKVDSGNSGYNVIHGEEFHREGDILVFKTFDKNGQPRRVSKKIVETLHVHIGGGNIQERPVVELDVKFAEEDYKKVLFSVTDRSANDFKVLISSEFVNKELDALIDVGAKNLTADGRQEVDYDSKDSVNEGFLDDALEGPSTAVNSVGKAALGAVGNVAKAGGKALKYGAAGALGAAALGTKAGRAVLKHGGKLAWEGGKLGVKGAQLMMKKFGQETEVKQLLQTDIPVIKSALKGSPDVVQAISDATGIGKGYVGDKVTGFKVLDYLGNTWRLGKMGKIPSQKEFVKSLQQQNEMSKKMSTSDLVEAFFPADGKLLLEADETPVEGQEDAQTREANEKEEARAMLQRIMKSYNALSARKQFILYYVGVSGGTKREDSLASQVTGVRFDLESAQRVLKRACEKAYAAFEAKAEQMFKKGLFTAADFKPIIEILSDSIKREIESSSSADANQVDGLFCLVSGSLGNRKVSFFKNSVCGKQKSFGEGEIKEMTDFIDKMCSDIQNLYTEAENALNAPAAQPNPTTDNETNS